MKIRKYYEKDEPEANKIFTQYWTDKEFLDELSGQLNTETCKFFIAEENGEILGIAGLRKPPEYLNFHADTKNPVELYIIASKYQNRGIGNFLGQKIIEGAKNSGFTEILCYSPETHSSSWKFYKKLGFTKHGIINDPDDGYPGMLWKKSFDF